jgi:hypothetical protein
MAKRGSIEWKRNIGVGTKKAMNLPGFKKYS